jgi:hypothetical protein
MSQSKLQIAVGNVSFSGEGEQSWLAEQLEKVLRTAQHIGGTQRATADGDQQSTTESGETVASGGSSFTTTLAKYIVEKRGTDNQVDRFLITADWLRLRGVKQLTTAAVSAALRNNHQKRLANAADCLNKNVSKGFCEKVNGGFFITPDGLKKIAEPKA